LICYRGFLKIKLGGTYIFQKLNTVERFIYVIIFLCSKQMKVFLLQFTSPYWICNERSWSWLSLFSQQSRSNCLFRSLCICFNGHVKFHCYCSNNFSVYL